MTNIPANAPTITPLDGRIIAVSTNGNSAVGGYVFVAEKQADGTWFAPQNGGEQFADPNFANDVAAAAGELAWLGSTGIPRVNAILSALYGASANSVGSRMNGILGQCKLSLKNGVPGFY